MARSEPSTPVTSGCPTGSSLVDSVALSDSEPAANVTRAYAAASGELPEDELGAYGDDGADLPLALARQVASGATDGEIVEDVFLQATTAAAAAEESLMDDGWQTIVPEPEAVLGTGSGATGNGHPKAIGLGPSAELVLGNGHHDEAPAPWPGAAWPHVVGGTLADRAVRRHWELAGRWVKDHGSRTVRSFRAAGEREP